MVKVVLTWKEQVARFTRGYGSFRTVIQLPEDWPLYQDLPVRNPDLSILRRKTSLPQMQGQQTTDTQMYRTGSGETVLFMQTINSHNHTRNHRATNVSKYKTIKANSKELNTKNIAEQKVGTCKGAIRSTTNH